MRKKSQEIDRFYADNQIEQMPKLLADYWAGEIDGDSIACILLSGNEGYKNINKDSLIEEFETVFGEDYFWGD
tara:strand:+ start:488 stop:706 length:219 start_codon:yes stop_codon:yes gene_type:complete